MTSSLPDDPTRLLCDLDFVRNLAQRLCADVHTAEDVAQEAMTTVFSKPPARAVANRRGWLTTVTRNLAHNQRRAKRRRAAREQAAAGSTTAPSTAEVVEREQLRTAVVRAVLDLPEPYRTVILLRHYRGHDVARCATELGVSESTVRTQLSRGIERLRMRLDREHDGDRDQWVSGLVAFVLPRERVATSTTAVATVSKKSLAAAAVVVVILSTALFVGFWPEGVGQPPSRPAAARDPLAASATKESRPGPGTVEQSKADRVAVATAGGEFARGEATTGSGRRPVANARIAAWATIGDPQRSDILLPIGELRADSEGRFAVPLSSLAHLSSAARSQAYIRVRAHAAGFVPESAEAGLIDILARPSEALLTCDLSEGRAVTGRVIDASGKPVASASIAGIHTGGKEHGQSDEDGVFAFRIGDESAWGEFVVVASRPELGMSAPARHWLGRGHALAVGDLVLQERRTIEGAVRFPDGSPVVDTTVTIELEEAEQTANVVVAGVTVPPWSELEQARAKVRTDRAGGYRFCCAEGGRYSVEVDEVVREVDLGGNVTRAVVNFDLEPDDKPEDHAGQIHVRIEDEQGQWLPDVQYGVHLWYPGDADAAQARFEAEGPSLALLETTRLHYRDGGDPGIPTHCPPGGFALIEATCHDAAPAYAGCRLGPDQYSAAVTVVVRPPQGQGALDIVVRDAQGEQITPVWVRISRFATNFSAPITPRATRRGTVPVSNISGPWFELPTAGRLVGLPVGPWTIEVLPGRRQLARFEHEFPYPIMTHAIEIERGRARRLDVRAVAGAMVQFDLRVPQLPARQRVGAVWPRSIVVGIGDGRFGDVALRQLDTDFADGVGSLRTRLALAPGTYRLSGKLQARIQHWVSDPRPRKGSWRPTSRVLAAQLPETVEVTAGMAPIVVWLEP